MEIAVIGSDEFTLGFRNLRVDRRDVPGEIVAVEGQRHHEIAQDFSHRFHLDFSGDLQRSV